MASREGKPLLLSHLHKSRNVVTQSPRCYYLCELAGFHLSKFGQFMSVPCRPHSHWCQTLPGLWPRPRHPTHPHWHPHRERNAQLPLRGVQDKTVKMLQHPLFAWRRFETGKIELQKLVYIQGRASSASIKWNIAIIHNTSDYQFSINYITATTKAYHLSSPFQFFHKSLL